MSASNIGQAIVNLLSTGSAFSSSIVSLNDFNVLDAATGCSLVVTLAGMTDEPIVYGNPRTRWVGWQYEIHGFLKDTGDPVGLLNNCILIADEVRKLLDSTDTLSGSAIQSKLTNGRLITTSFPPQAYTMGGHDWKVWTWNVLAHEKY